MQIHTPDMFCLSGHGPLAMKTSICQTALRMPPWMWQKARASKHWQLVMVSEFRVQGPARTFIMWWNSDYHVIYFPIIVWHGDLVNSSLGCLLSVWVTQINVGPIIFTVRLLKIYLYIDESQRETPMQSLTN